MELSCFTVLGNGPPRQCTGKDVSLLKTHEKEMFLAKANPHMFILRFCYKVLILPFTTRAVFHSRWGRGVVLAPGGLWGWMWMCLWLTWLLPQAQPCPTCSFSQGARGARLNKFVSSMDSQDPIPAPLPQDPETSSRQHRVSWMSRSKDGRRNKSLENQGGMWRASFFSSNPSSPPRQAPTSPISGWEAGRSMERTGRCTLCLKGCSAQPASQAKPASQAWHYQILIQRKLETQILRPNF